MPTCLLHICCGPCATVVIERLRDTHDLTGFFYNPNVYPAEEYERRLAAAREVCADAGIPLVEGIYDPERFEAAVRGLEQEPENGARCPVCYRLRFDETARIAAERGFECIASTLTTGPRKPAVVINPIGETTAAEAGIAFNPGDWKKLDGFRQSCERSRELGIYRQHYCGCRYSLPGNTSE